MALFTCIGALLPVWAATVRLGSKDTYTAGAGTASIPIYLVNFDTVALEALQFSLNHPSLAFKAAKLEPQLQNNWTLKSEKKSDTQVHITLTSQKGGIKLKTGPLMTLTFDASGLGGNESRKLEFANSAITPSGGNSLKTAGWQIINKQPPPKGDLNKDAVVDINDVNLAWQIFTNPEASLNAEKTELTGVSPTGLQDIALLYRHAIGLLPSLPQPPLPGKKIPEFLSDSAEFQISEPQKLAGQFYLYKIKAKNIQGLNSATFDLKVDAAVISDLKMPTTTSASAFTHLEKLSDKSYRIHMISPQPVGENDFVWLNVPAQHKSGQTKKGILSIHPISLNEGAIQTEKVVLGCTNSASTNFNSKATVDDGSCRGGVTHAGGLLLRPGQLTFTGEFLVLQNPQSLAGSYRLLGISGRRVVQGPIPPQSLCRLLLPPLADGRYFLDLRLGQGRTVTGFYALQGRIFGINQ